MRNSIFYLVAYLAFFYNIERLDVGQENLINISTMVYVLALIAVSVIVMWRPISRIPQHYFFGIWILIFGFARVAAVFILDRPLYGGIYTYLSITEFSLFIIGVGLAYNVAIHLDDFEDAVRNITLGDIRHRVRHLNEATDEIQKEFVRSRRHNYPLSAIVIEPVPSSVEVTLNRSVLEIQQSMMTRYVLTNLMRIASGFIRRTDMIIDKVIDQDRFVILTPDTGVNDAFKLAERLREDIASQLGVDVCCGLASFPQEALTFEELITIANHKIQCEKELAKVEEREPSIVQ